MFGRFLRVTLKADVMSLRLYGCLVPARLLYAVFFDRLNGRLFCQLYAGLFLSARGILINTILHQLTAVLFSTSEHFNLWIEIHIGGLSLSNNPRMSVLVNDSVPLALF